MGLSLIYEFMTAMKALIPQTKYKVWNYYFHSRQALFVWWVIVWMVFSDLSIAYSLCQLNKCVPQCIITYTWIFQDLKKLNCWLKQIIVITSPSAPCVSMGRWYSHAKSWDLLSKVKNCSGEVNFGWILTKLGTNVPKLLFNHLQTVLQKLIQFQKRKMAKNGQKPLSYAIEMFCAIVVSMVLSP